MTKGHTLVIPRRHVETYFDASAEEQAELWRAVEAVKAELDATRPENDCPAFVEIGLSDESAPCYAENDDLSDCLNRATR